MKDAYYFSHDSNARHDMKIKEMRCVYGGEGYGWYWMLVEIMREQSDYKLKYDGQYSAQIYADELGTTPEKAKRFIDDCINEFGLFTGDGKHFWSESFLRRMEKVDNVRERLIDAGKKGAEIRWGSNSTLNSTPIAVKESKVKKSKVKNKYGDYVTMTKVEYNKLVTLIGERNTKSCITKLNDYKGAKGKKYKSDYLAIRNWVIKEVTGKPTSAWEMDKPVVRKCKNCGKSLENEIRNGVHHCYECDAPIKEA